MFHVKHFDEFLPIIIYVERGGVMEEMVNLITSNGMAIVIIAYFLYKDYKFNDQIINVLSEVKDVLTALKTWHEAEDKGVY